MNLLVTGAAGSIEPTHVRMLRADEASDAPRTTALDRLARAGALGHPELGLPRLEFVQGGIREAGPVDEPRADADQVVPSVTQSHADRSIASVNDFVLGWDTRGADRDRVNRPKVRTELGHRGQKPLKRHAQGLS